jgi:hypothetical protein
MSEALRTTSLSRQTDLRQILAKDDAREHTVGTPVEGLRKWPYQTDQLHLWFGIEWDTVHPIGYQRIGAANPLVGGVTQQADTARQALAVPTPVR